MIFLDYFKTKEQLKALEEYSKGLLERISGHITELETLKNENNRLKIGELYGLNPLLILSDHIPLFDINETGEPALQNMSPDEYKEHLRQIHSANNEAVHYELDKMLAGINRKLVIDGDDDKTLRQLMVFIVGLKARFATLSLKYRAEFLKEDTTKQKVLSRSNTVIN